MDISDLLILIFIVSGLLSSLAGKKKRGQQKPRPLPQAPRPRPERQPVPGPGAPAPEPRVDAVDAGPVPSPMEQILQQLGLDVDPEPEGRDEPASHEEVAVLHAEPTAARLQRRSTAIRHTGDAHCQSTKNLILDMAGPMGLDGGCYGS